MAPHSSTLACKVPWTEEPGGLLSTGSLRVGHDWATSLSLFIFMHWRRQWQPTPVFLPGESQGRGSLVGCRLWGRTELDTTEVTSQQQQKQGVWGNVNWLPQSRSLVDIINCLLLVRAIRLAEWLSGKESTWNAGDAGDGGSIPRSGRSSREGNGNPLQYSCLRNPTESELGRLQLTGSQRVEQNWSNLTGSHGTSC